MVHSLAPDLDPIALSRALVAIDSVNPDLVAAGAGETEIAQFCASWLSGHGFDVHRLEHRPGRPSIVGIARGSGGGRSLMLNGHLDTVGINDLADPFSLAQRSDLPVGDTLHGRGAFDMKSGVAAIMVAAASAKQHDLAGDVLVTLVADEEFGSLGTEEVLAAYTADAAIVTEPTELQIVLAHRGFAWFDIELKGVAAHGSMPDQGIDAIQHAGLVMRALDELRDRIALQQPHPLLGHGTVRVSMIRGGQDAATVASACRLTIERRTLPGEMPHDVENELRELLQAIADRVSGFVFTLNAIVARAALDADPGSPIVGIVSRHASRTLGHPASTRGEPFWTDAGLIAEAGIPCLLLGVDGGGAHAVDEWTTSRSVGQLTEILTGTIIEFCGPLVADPPTRP